MPETVTITCTREEAHHLEIMLIGDALYGAMMARRDIDHGNSAAGARVLANSRMSQTLADRVSDALQGEEVS